MDGVNETRIRCSKETRDLLKPLKRGGESYDELLRKMIDQYDPEAALNDEAAPVSSGAKNG